MERDSGKPVRIAVIIPVYGNWVDTLECLDTLMRQSTRDFEVWTSDDGSPSPPPRPITEEKFGHYLRGDHAGYGPNCGRAVREAIAYGATHLLLLNNDVHFGDRFMESWLRHVAQMPDTILSPLVHWARHPRRIWSSGGRLSVLTPFMRSRRRFSSTTEVDTVTGCAIMIPSSVWVALGGFDPNYVMYFEDFDLTLRAKAKGIRTCVVPDPDLAVLHRVSGSFRASGVWPKHYLMLSSSLIFIRTHYRGAKRFICFALEIAHLSFMALRSLPELPRPGLLWKAIERGFAGRITAATRDPLN